MKNTVNRQGEGLETAVFEPFSIVADGKVYAKYSLKGYANALHFHNVLEIGFCEEGEGVCQTDGVSAPFSKGDIIVVFPFQKHKNYSANEKRCAVLFAFLDPFALSTAVSGDCLELIRLIEKNGIYGVITKDDSKLYPLLKMLLDTMCSEKSRTRTGKLYYGLMLSLTELAEQSEKRAVGKKTALPKKISSLRSALDYLNACLDNGEAPSVADMARASFMSVSAFRRAFGEVMSMPPKKYITSCMIQKGCYLLISTQMSIGEVAVSSGFKEISTFNRAFENITGTSPRRYREAELTYK